MFLSLFFPRCCPMCGAYMDEQQHGKEKKRGKLCSSCMQSLPRTEQAQLRGNSTEETLTGGRTIVKKSMRLERAAAFLFFDKAHPIQEVIHKLKYGDRPMIGYHLGRQAAMEFQYADFFDGIDVIVPVPLHPKRLRERGYNQSEYIAKGISDVTGIPLDTTHVIRVRNTPKQARQDAEGRKHNVVDAFAVNHPEYMYRKHILLVDDLVTTGETVRSCLRTMKAFRGATFSIFALCKAR